jgi:DNA repair protein RadC
MVHHYSSLLDKSLSEAFKADDGGYYQVSRAVSANEIIQAAKTLLSQRFQKWASLADYQTIKDFLLAQLSGHYEILAAVFMDAEFQVIGFELLSSGIVEDNPSGVSLRVARRALELDARKVVVAHNVLADQSRPLPADKQIATRLQVTLEALEIECFDYCVVSGAQVISLAEWGFLSKKPFTD